MLGKVGKDFRNIEIIGHGHLTRSNLQQLFGLLQVCPPVMRGPAMVERGVELPLLLLRPMTTSLPPQSLGQAPVKPVEGEFYTSPHRALFLEEPFQPSKPLA